MNDTMETIMHAVNQLALGEKFARWWINYQGYELFQQMLAVDLTPGVGRLHLQNAQELIATLLRTRIIDKSTRALLLRAQSSNRRVLRELCEGERKARVERVGSGPNAWDSLRG